MTEKTPDTSMTRYMTMCPLLDMTIKAVVAAIQHNWIQYFGLMSILVSDQGPQFRGAEFQTFCERWGIKLNFSLAYSASGNDCCEVLHRIIAQRLQAQPESHNWVDALPKIILAMNTFVKQDIKMSAAMKVFNTNLRLPTQPLFNIFEKSNAYVDRTDRDKPAETRQVRPGRDELDKVENAEYVYLREGRSHHKLDPKYTGLFKVDCRHGTVVWIWRNGSLEPHKLDRVIAAGQLDLGRLRKIM